MKKKHLQKNTNGIIWYTIKMIFSFILLFSVLKSADAQVELLEESIITDEGLYFYYSNGQKAYHYNPNISPRGDCFTVVNGYVFFGWYKGGMTNRKLMVSRKKIGSGTWKHVEFPHRNTLIQPGNRWGDSHRTISMAVSKIDGTVHIFYDHHNDPLNYIVSKKDIAFAPNSDFKYSNFNETRDYLAEGQKLRITYPKITQNDRGEIILNYRKGSAVGGNEMVHVYNGETWTRSKQVIRGAGRPHVAEEDKNYAYGRPAYGNGDVYYAFSVRWASKKPDGILNEGVYIAKCGPTMTDQWEDLNGVKHSLPIQDYSPFLVELPPSNAGKGSSGGPGLSVSENGDVHISYNGRGSGNTYKYTYIRKAEENNFTRHDGTLKTGLPYGNRFYNINVKDTVITVSSFEPGTIITRNEITLRTNRKFGVSASYISDDKLVLIVSENKNADKKKIYCYVFKLPTDDEQILTAQLTSPRNNAIFNLGDAIELKADASVTNGSISKVNFRVNGVHIKTDVSQPYSFNWIPENAGEYTIDAVAIADDGERKISESRTIVVNELPITIERVEDEQSPNVATNLLDGDIGNDSRWSAQVFPKSVVFDLGASKQITETNMWAYENRAYQYKIEVSESPYNGYSIVVDQTNNTNSSQPLSASFNSTGRYVKLTVTGAHAYSNNWVSINEFEILTNGAVSRLKNAAIVSNKTSKIRKEVSVYPNPTKNFINISLKGFNKAKVLLYSMNGKLVYKTITAKNALKIPTANRFKPGVYLIKVVGGNGKVFNTKVIVK